MRNNGPGLGTKLFAIAAWWVIFMLSCGAARLLAAPLAAGSESVFEHHPDLTLSLFAQEPDVVDPVAMTFDERGRMYVVEMRDYPLGIGSGHDPGGTLRLLEDRDADGRCDRSTLFAEGLRFPTSVAVWKGGVFVTAPPDLLYLKDTTGDGKADQREVVLTGFTLGVTDSNVNGLRWSLDNRVHGANGGNGGTLTAPQLPGFSLPLGRWDFCLDPRNGSASTTFQSGSGFGLVFDDWGRSFATYNIDHIQHRVLPRRYLERSPGLRPTDLTVNISDHGEAGRIYPVAPAQTRPNHPEQAGHFSAAGGLGYIGSAAYPAQLQGAILVCDVVGNLVHRDMLEPDGPSFVARRAPEETEREFIAGRDPSFRPVGVELGSDGALYLIDMQRDVIEHPDYIPHAVRQKLELRVGADRGRIYRITPARGLPKPPRLLSGAPTSRLVRALADANQWRRLTAQRLLIERADPRSTSPLRALLRASSPLGRLHALWTLDGLGTLAPADIERALADPHPGVRENALRVVESYPGNADRLWPLVQVAAADPDARVRFQAALTLGARSDARTSAALRAILVRDAQSPWTRLAVLTALTSGVEEFLDALMSEGGTGLWTHDGMIAAARELADLAAARFAPGGLETLNRWLERAAGCDHTAARAALLAGLLEGLPRGRSGLVGDAQSASLLARCEAGASTALLGTIWQLGRLLRVPESERQRATLASALHRMKDRSRAPSERLADIHLIRGTQPGGATQPLLELLDGRETATIQLAALDALPRTGDQAVAGGLIARWQELAPAARSRAIGMLLQRTAFHAPFVDAIESGRLTLGELNLDLEQRRRLLHDSAPEVRARAARLIRDEEYGHRNAAVADWLSRLPPHGDAAQGALWFEKLCASCHRANGRGHHVGPDLTALSHRSVEDLVSNILDPNMALNPRYITYEARTRDGEIETGILESETTDSVTLLQAQGLRRAWARADLERLTATNRSLMPEGLEAGLTPQDLRDLAAFLQRPVRP